MFAEDDGLCNPGGQPSRIRHHMDRNVGGGTGEESKGHKRKRTRVVLLATPYTSPDNPPPGAAAYNIYFRAVCVPSKNETHPKAITITFKRFASSIDGN